MNKIKKNKKNKIKKKKKRKGNLFLVYGPGPTPESIQVHDPGLGMEMSLSKYLAQCLSQKGPPGP